MNVLVLGGTSFVGRAIVDDLIARDHAPTLFSRGVTGTELFPGIARLVGDRETGAYAAVAGSHWDAVVDVSGYVPRQVAQACDAVTQGRYLFISTGSVYDRTRASDGMTEDSPRLPAYRESEEITGDTYGRLKVACEDDVLSRFGDRATIVRPGIVAGPHDSSDRFTYWVRRAARGGRVALPGRPDQPVQVVDARDLARLVVRLLEDDQPGTYNAVGTSLTLAELIGTCAAAPLDLVQVETRAGFPLVLPDPSWDPLFRRSAAAAHAVGLPVTPLAQTAADTLAWDRERGEPPLIEGWSADDETAALAAR